MALINCPECGKEISDKAKACIHCGYPLEDVKISIRNESVDGSKTKEMIDDEEKQRLIERAYQEVSADEQKEKRFYEQREKNQGNVNPNITNTVKCPKCGSTQIQMVPRKWSLGMGLLTNKVDRVCVNCKKKF